MKKWKGTFRLIIEQEFEAGDSLEEAKKAGEVVAGHAFQMESGIQYAELSKVEEIQ